LNQTLTEQELYGLAAVVALLFVVSAAAAWWRRRPRDPEQTERKRRARVNQIGRIVEGYVLEIFEVPLEVTTSTTRFTSFRRKKSGTSASVNGSRKLVRYSYSISGVTYEAAQDLTDLEERACLERLVNGQHVSVKYEPSNPSNSILVADDWSGLQ
jgi:hypothetical protein